MAERPRFHLALPVDDLAAAEAFYVGILGAEVGRVGDTWIDLAFWDHQLTVHLIPGSAPSTHVTHPVDHDEIPVRHFGVILPRGDWEALSQRLAEARLPFLLEPRIRFEGEIGEQATLFVQDPAGNALEFKSFRDPSQVFAR